MENDTDLVLWATIAICALVGGIVALVYKKPILIVCTAWIGAVIAVRGVGYFAGHYPTPEQLQNAKEQVEIPDAWYGYLVGTVVLCAVGMLVQFNAANRRKSNDLYSA